MVATPPLFQFISYFVVPEPRIELGASLQQHDALPVGYVATLVGYVATLSGLHRHPTLYNFCHTAFLVGLTCSEARFLWLVLKFLAQGFIGRILYFVCQDFHTFLFIRRLMVCFCCFQLPLVGFYIFHYKCNSWSAFIYACQGFPGSFRLCSPVNNMYTLCAFKYRLKPTHQNLGE